MSSKAAEQDGKGSVVMDQNRTELPEGHLTLAAGQQLLPGIPDEITIDFVATKLPWTSFHMLASVSRGWQHAIRSHHIYDARVRSQSTQTLVVINPPKYGNRENRKLALYNFSDGSIHHLPLFPVVHFNGELRHEYQCISLDNKVYVLGGDCVVSYRESGIFGSGAVYMLDIAGGRKWKKCASMQIPRRKFGCAVMNAKIYVVGGTTSQNHRLSASEVYDPESDAWSPIAPMKHSMKECAMGDAWSSIPRMFPPPFRQNAVAMGEELFAYSAGVAEAGFYDPLKNQWRVIHVNQPMQEYRGQQPVQEYPGQQAPIMLMVGGKLLNLTWRGTKVYSDCENSWKHSQSCSFGVFGPADSFLVDLRAAVTVDDELLAVVGWTKLYGQYRDADQGCCLMRSDGLSSQTREIMWHDMQCSLFEYSEDSGCQQFLRAIQL